MAKEEQNNKKYNELIDKIYKEDYTFFYKIAYKILANNADAEDAVSVAFLKLYKYKDKISKMKCPEIRRYCVSIVRSASIDVSRKQKKIIFSEFSEQIIDSTTYIDSMVDMLQKTEEREELHALLDILNETEYKILQFKTIDGLTFKQISKKIGISEEAVKKRYQRTLKKLRNENKRREK